MYLYDNGFKFFKMGYASAMAWILFVIIMALTAIVFITSKRWVHYQDK
jgi:multiple sugar transport system permease protein